MRYILLLIVAFACSTPKGQEYVPNQEAVELNNKASELMFNLPMFDTTNHRTTYEQALELLDRALKIDKKNSIIYDNKHQALVELGRYEEAISTLVMATENINNFAEGFMGIAFIHEYLNNPSVATLNYEKAIEKYELRNRQSNKEERIHNDCEIAFATLCLKKRELAIKMVNELVSKYPNNEEAKMYLELISTFDKGKFINDRFGRL